MPLSCCAFGCTNKYFPGTKKQIPANEDQRIKWIAGINRNGVWLRQTSFNPGLHGVLLLKS